MTVENLETESLNNTERFNTLIKKTVISGAMGIVAFVFGLPALQLSLNTFSGQLFWLFVLLCSFLFLHNFWC